MSFWDNVKKFAQPYADDDYDDYDDEMEDSFEEEAPQPERTPRFGRREAAPAQEPAYAPAVNNTTAFTPASTGFNGQVVNTEETMMEAYAITHKADAIVGGKPNGHARLVVFRCDDGHALSGKILQGGYSCSSQSPRGGIHGRNGL